MIDQIAARKNMIDGQIRPNKVTDTALLDALAKVPREQFVNPDCVGIAYSDQNIDLGDGRYLMDPVVFARMVQALSVDTDETVMVIGDGCGYGAAVLSHLAAKVIYTEVDAMRADQARERFRNLELRNIEVRIGGVPTDIEVDAVLVEGAVAEIPDLWRKAMGQYGRMAVVLAAPRKVGQAMLVSPIGMHVLFDVQMPWLPGHAPKPGFQF